MHTINWLKDKKGIAPKQSQSTAIKNIRIIKKTNQLYKSVQSHSRQIISNIFSSVTSNNDQLQLQLKAKDWQRQYKNPILKSQTILPQKKQQKPLTNLLILLKHLSKGFYIQICSFIFLDKDAVYLAEKDQTLRIEKAKKQKAKLKYWLSHLYFNRIKGKLSEQLLGDFKVSGELIHHNEQKQYMPSCVLGRSQPTPIVRGVKVTRSSMYRSHGQQQQPFCIVHYHNSNQQLLTLSEALSFIDYPFNIAQVSYFHVLPKLKDASNSIITHHSKKKQKIQQKIKLDKLKRIFSKQDHWQMLKEDLQDQKNNLMKSQQYQSYAELIMLEMIAFIETKNYVQIKEIKIEWVINKQNQIVLSNAEIYRLVESVKPPQNNEGLVTLYEKCQFNRLKTNPINQSDYRYSPLKKMKSQQKYLNKSQPKLPLLFWQKKPGKQDMKIKKKANSCVLRTTHKTRSPF